MKIAPIKINKKRMIILPKIKIKNNLKYGDIIFCKLNKKINFYAKVYRCSRSLAISIPRKTQFNNNLKNNVLFIKKLKILNNKNKKIRNKNLLNVPSFISKFHKKWLCVDWSKKDLVIMYFRKGTRPTPIKLNKSIDLNDRFFEFLGLLEGELLKSKSKNSGFYFSFSNNRPEIIKNIISQLKIFEIRKNEIKYEVRVNSELNKKNEEKVINFWRKSLEIYKFPIKIRRYKDVNKKYGLCVLIYCSTILAELLNSFLNNIRIIFFSKNSLKAFLRGWSAADGSIHKKPRFLLIDSFQIAVKNEKRIKLLNEILIKLRFRYNPSKKNEIRYIRISGIDNFIKLLKMDIFKLHLERKKKFLIYLKNSRYIKTFKELNKFSKSFTIKEFMEKTSLKNYAPTYMKLKDYVRKGYLKIHNKSKINKLYKFSNTNHTRNTCKMLKNYDLI